MKCLRVAIFLILPTGLYSQIPPVLEVESYTKGIYKTFDEFKTNNPSVRIDFSIAKRWNDKLQLISKDSSISTGAINSLWGFSTGDSIYVNVGNYQSAHGFVNLTNIGRYSYFKDEIIVKNAGAGAGDFTGGNIAGFYGSRETPLILNVNNGRFYILYKSTLKIILKSDPDLLEGYESEKKKKDIDTQFSYLERYNKRNKDQIDELKTAEIIIVRRSKKEVEQILPIVVNDHLLGELGVLDSLSTELIDPVDVEVCASKECFQFSFSTERVNYLECHWSEKDNSISIKWMPKKEAEFYLNKIRNIKAKREE